MSLRSSSQQPPDVYVKCDPSVNRTRHVVLVTCAIPLGHVADKVPYLSSFNEKALHEFT